MKNQRIARANIGNGEIAEAATVSGHDVRKHNDMLCR